MLVSAFEKEEFTLIESNAQYFSGGILLFVRYAADLEEHLTSFLADHKSDCHWIAYPKKASRLSTDFGRSKGWESLLKNEYLPVRQVALDMNWCALRFRHESAVKKIERGIDPMGIDRGAKTVAIPTDLQVRLEKEGLLDGFESLNYTRRKEYVISVLQAKKEETKEKRIKKILADLATY